MNTYKMCRIMLLWFLCVALIAAPCANAQSSGARVWFERCSALFTDPAGAFCDVYLFSAIRSSPKRKLPVVNPVVITTTDAQCFVGFVPRHSKTDVFGSSDGTAIIDVQGAIGIFVDQSYNVTRAYADFTLTTQKGAEPKLSNLVVRSRAGNILLNRVSAEPADPVLDFAEIRIFS